MARKLICIALGIAAYSLTSRANCEEAPLIAYGASASAEEVVAVRFAAMDGKLAPEIVQREPLGFEAAPIVFHDQHRLLYVASLRAKEAALISPFFVASWVKGVFSGHALTSDDVA